MLYFLLALLVLGVLFAINQYQKNSGIPTVAEADAQSEIDIAALTAHRRASIAPPTGWPAVPITNPDALPGDPYP